MAIALALAAALCYGAGDFFGGLASRRMPAVAVVAFVQVAGALVLALVWPFVPGAHHVDVRDAGIGAAAGVAGAIAIVALYAALAIGRMGVVSPVTAVIGASVPVVVGFGLGERVGAGGVAGVVLAFLAVALVSANLESRSFSLREPGIGLALVSGLAIGGLYVLLAGGRADAAFERLACARGTSFAVLLIYAFVRGENLRPVSNAMRFVVAAGVLDMSANILYVLAASSGMLAIVALITSLYPASTVFLARYVLDERLSRSQWFGVGLATCAIVLIAKFR